jgi:hypothetical protein
MRRMTGLVIVLGMIGAAPATRPATRPSIEELEAEAEQQRLRVAVLKIEIADRQRAIDALQAARSRPASKPASRPAKPPTIAELMADNERLLAEGEQLLRTRGKLQAPPERLGVPAIEVGMTLAEVEKAADPGPKLHLDADDGTTQEYSVWINDDGVLGAKVPSTHRYTLQVRGGKVVSFTRDAQR